MIIQVVKTFFVCILCICFSFYFSNNFKNNLKSCFIFTVLGLCCCLGFCLVAVWVSHCGGFSCWGAQALGPVGSVVVVPGLQSTGSVVLHGMWGPPRHVGSSMACGILPDWGLNPCPLHWPADSLPLSHQESPLVIFLMFYFEIIIDSQKVTKIAEPHEPFT